MTIISIKDLTKSYQDKKITNCILHNVNLDINSGDFILIMGQSGSGKSTLLNTISTLLSFDSGSIEYFGKNIKDFKYSEIQKMKREKFGFVFQSFDLIADLNCYDNILLAKKIANKADSYTVDEVLKLVGISHLKNKEIDEMSGGEKQRVAIARALVNKPEIIFADEPVGSLDSKTGNEILDLLKEINTKLKTTILMVSHLESNKVYSTRFIKIKDGVIDEA